MSSSVCPCTLLELHVGSPRQQPTGAISAHVMALTHKPSFGRSVSQKCYSGTNYVSKNFCVGIETDKKLVPLKSGTTKIICKLFISGKFEPPICEKLFSKQYNIYDEGTWRIIYSLPARVTTDIKIRMFQCKILNNILFLNQRLHYMKKRFPLCSLCKKKVETVPHLFLKCRQSENFWLSTQNWCNQHWNCHTCQKTLYIWILINHIIMLCKYFNYSTRNDTKRVNFHAI